METSALQRAAYAGKNKVSQNAHRIYFGHCRLGLETVWTQYSLILFALDDRAELSRDTIQTPRRLLSRQLFSKSYVLNTASVSKISHNVTA
jgi:hypothetical protein